MAYFCSLSFKDRFSFFLQKMLTGEATTNIKDMTTRNQLLEMGQMVCPATTTTTTTTIQDINQIIILISILFFSSDERVNFYEDIY